MDPEGKHKDQRKREGGREHNASGRGKGKDNAVPALIRFALPGYRRKSERERERERRKMCIYANSETVKSE